MRVVHVEDFFHPDAGYQVNQLSPIQVKQGHEVFVITAELDKIPDYLTHFFGKSDLKAKDDEFQRRTGVKIIRLPLLGFVSGRAVFPSSIFKLVESLRPDIGYIHGESTLTGIRFTWKADSLGYPLVLDSHMVEMATVNRFALLFRWIYKAAIAPIIIRRRIPLIRVMDSDYVEKCLGIPLERTRFLSFGTDPDFFKPDAEARATFRRVHGIPAEAFVVIYAGKIDAAKGGLFFAKAIQRRLQSKDGRPIFFLIVGNPAGEYGAQVESLFQRSENRIIRFPTQTYPTLPSFFQAADIAVFPRQCSMSFYEVQSCGLPVLFEDNEINRKRCSHGNAKLFAAEQEEAFREAILDIEALEPLELKQMQEKSRNYILDNFNYLPIAGEISAILAKAVADFPPART